MKNVFAFMLGMAATIAAIKLATKDGDNYDDFYDYEIEEALLLANYNPRKYPINLAEEKRKQDRKALLTEQDYELQSLSHAISTQDEAEQKRSKARLAEIHNELEALK